MPEDFDRCVAGGGRVRTVVPKKGRYLHVCWKGGKSYSGEVKKKKTGGKLRQGLRKAHS